MWRFALSFLESWESCDISKVQGNNFKSDDIVQSISEALSSISQDEVSDKSGEDAAFRKGGSIYGENFSVAKKKRKICKDITILCFHSERSGFVKKPLKFVWCGIDTYFIWRF